MKRTLLHLCVVVCLALAPSLAHAQKVGPKPVTTPSPGYPEDLTDSGLSGRAEVDLTVKADGSVADQQLAMASHRAFGRAALAVVAGWHFEPGMRDGVAVDTKVSIPFVFTAPFEQQINALFKRKVFVTLADPVTIAKDFTGKLKVKKDATPSYPRGISGSRSDEKVQVNFVITPEGKPVNPTVVGSPRKEFIAPAIQAIAQMTYEPPTMKDGKVVYVEATKTLKFTDEGSNRGGGDEGGGRRRGGGGGGGGMGGGFGGGGGGGGGFGGGGGGED